MNKRGGIISHLLTFVIIFAVWAFWLGSWINDWAANTIAEGQITGFQAFLLSNLNLWIAFCMAAGLFAYLKYGGA